MHEACQVRSGRERRARLFENIEYSVVFVCRNLAISWYVFCMVKPVCNISPLEALVSVRPTPQFDTSRPILVAVDANAGGDDVVASVLPLCVRLGAPVVLLDVVHAPSGVEAGAVGALGDVEQSLESDACSHLRPLGEILTLNGVQARWMVREGDVVETVLKTATAVNAQMIVVGTHARSGLSRWVFGSVAETLVRTATLPVLVVRDHSDASVAPSPVQVQAEAEAMG